MVSSNLTYCSARGFNGKSFESHVRDIVQFENVVVNRDNKVSVRVVGARRPKIDLFVGAVNVVLARAVKLGQKVLQIKTLIFLNAKGGLIANNVKRDSIAISTNRAYIQVAS